MKYMI